MLAVKIKHETKVLKEEEAKELFEKLKDNDIIIESFYEEITYENGIKKIEMKSQKTNLTKKINATKKLIKNEMAKEKIAELNKLFR